MQPLFAYAPPYTNCRIHEVPHMLAVQALSKIQEASDPSATHNCWAFKVSGNARSNDDGEPSGTAGKPILGAIEGDGLDGVAVLVVR